MTQASSNPVPQPSADHDAEHPPETFVAVTIRRLRYLIAIALCAAAYVYLGWLVAQPPAGTAGVSLLWHQANILGATVLFLITIAGVAISIPLCHPDAPYAGMWCTFLGLGAFAIRGGTIRQMLLQAQLDAHMPDLYHSLAAECFLWAALIFAADLATRFLWNRFYSNVHWIGRTGVNPVHVEKKPDHSATKPSARSVWIDSILALVVTCAIAYFLLGILLQSQLKGQVLVGSFLSFGLAALGARLLSPNADPLAYWLAVPATALAGYLMVNSNISIANGQMIVDGKAAAFGYFPGQCPAALGRALPIDYIAGGVPGAILGFYTAVRMHFHSASEKARNESKPD